MKVTIEANTASTELQIGELYKFGEPNDADIVHFIVLATDVGDESTMFSGTVLFVGTSNYHVGQHHSTWMREKFTRYRGKVVMES